MARLIGLRISFYQSSRLCLSVIDLVSIPSATGLVWIRICLYIWGEWFVIYCIGYGSRWHRLPWRMLQSDYLFKSTVAGKMLEWISRRGMNWSIWCLIQCCNECELRDDPPYFVCFCQRNRQIFKWIDGVLWLLIGFVWAGDVTSPFPSSTLKLCHQRRPDSSSSSSNKNNKVRWDSILELVRQSEIPRIKQFANLATRKPF